VFSAFSGNDATAAAAERIYESIGWHKMLQAV
jgi:hypothetical protein